MDRKISRSSSSRGTSASASDSSGAPLRALAPRTGGAPTLSRRRTVLELSHVRCTACVSVAIVSSWGLTDARRVRRNSGDESLTSTERSPTGRTRDLGSLVSHAVASTRSTAWKACVPLHPQTSFTRVSRNPCLVPSIARFVSTLNSAAWEANRPSLGAVATVPL